MGKNKEYELAIKIAGEVEKSFYESTKLTKKELRDMAKQAALTAQASEAMYGAASEHIMSMKNIFSQKNMKDIEPFFTGMEDVAVKSFKAISAAAAASGAVISSGLIASVNVGSEFESAFAGVEKTVDASNTELARMRDNIREMVKNEIPMAAAELSAIAESAGQLGIKNENIISFTGTMANMSVATDLDSDEAAAEFAKFANITNMSQDYFGNLGSSVVDLGNNMATQESNIVGMGMRIAAAGNQINLSEADIMAYAASLSSVGIEEEAGGTAFSKFIKNMQMAVETGNKLKEYASVAGMTGEEFKQAFGEDATKAINAFLAGLNDEERNGKTAIAVLDEMGLTADRMSDTLLRASNASGMFDEALELSTKAWDENTALANEAAMRYRTFENQCQMTQNKLNDLGITVYYGLRPALTEGISLVNGFIDTNLAAELDSLSKKVPTMTREAKEMASTISEFAQPFLAVGGFLKDNPGLLVGTIMGVGTSLATYKVASGILAVASAFKALNPAGMAILGIGGVAGVITGIGTAVKKAAADAKQANLAAHFGDISLSMVELQETAAFIAQSQNFEQLREAMTAMGMTEEIESEIRSMTEALNKMDWKVSIGMELTESEQEEYRKQIENFISSTQEYLTNEQYALNLSVNVLFGEDSKKGNAVMDAADDYFTKKQKELAKYQEDMQKLQDEYFSDGFLSSEESAEIAELREKIYQLQMDLTGNEYASNLDAITRKYQKGNLDADSMINLISEVTTESTKQASEYEKNYRNVLNKYGGIFSGEQYDTEAADATTAYLLQEVSREAQALQAEMNLIREAYREEFDPLIREMQQLADTETGNILRDVALGGAPNLHLEDFGESIVKSSDVSKDTRDAWADIYEPISSQYEHLIELERQLASYNIAIPDEVREIMATTGAFGGIAGDSEAASSLAGQLMAGKEEYQKYGEMIVEGGGYIPEQWAAVFSDGVAEYQSVINEAAKLSGNEASSEYVEECRKVFENAAFSIPVNIVQNGIGIAESNLVGHKDGGIFASPHLAWVAEAGYPESIIPLNGSKEAMDLWLKTGELMGMDGLTGGSEPLIDDIAELAYSGGGETVLQIDNSRIIYYNGSESSKEELENILEDENEKFARLMEIYLSNNRRTRFYD